MDSKLLKKEISWLLKEKYNNQLTEKAKMDIKKLKQNEPLAYLIGNQPFLNCKIDLKYKPLIPRPETENWTEKIISDIKKNKKEEIKCLDIFAGSGCIGIVILKHIKCVKVDFGEISKNFLEQIRTNLKINNIDKKCYHIIRSDIFSAIEGKYDYILANPPYIPEKAKKLIQKSVIEYEPLKALFAGKDGLFYIRPFLKKAKNYLKKNGKIYMEFDSAQKKKLPKILETYGYKNYQFFKDQYNKWRWIEVNNS
jgi:release factor glutamine methyltransferase